MSPPNRSLVIRYQPYQRLSAIHLTFPPETRILSKLTIHTVFGADARLPAHLPVPLFAQSSTEDAAAYFERLWITDQKSKPKPPGEAGRPGGGKGYTLSVKLSWPDSVYKDTQV